MDVIDRLNAAVQESRKSRKEIARDAGMSASKLTRVLRRQNRACVEDVEAVLRAIDRTMQSLFADDVEVDVRVALRVLTDYVDRHEPKSLPKPKRAASRVARAFEVAATPNVIVFDARQKSRIRIPDDLWERGARYAAKVVGDSMIDAGIEHGDIVYFRRSTTKRPPRGALVIIKVNQQDYLKRYDEAGGERRLLSENAAYGKMVLKPADDVELLGIVIRPAAEA